MSVQNWEEKHNSANKLNYTINFNVKWSATKKLKYVKMLQKFDITYKDEGKIDKGSRRDAN